MFNWVVRYLGFLRHVPLAPAVFDGLLVWWQFCFHRGVLAALDSLEEAVLGWEGVTTSRHRYGGTQFNYHGRELGHVHGNGLLDVLLSKQVRRETVAAGMARPHHVFPRSGWVSFYIRTEADVGQALALLALAKARRTDQEQPW